jgi:hypothetical protein
MSDIWDPRLAEFAMNCFVAGVYVFVGAYHIQIFSRRTEQKTYLWLALVCFAALSVDITGIVITLGPQPPRQGWVTLVNGISVVAASAFLLEFVEAIFGSGRIHLFQRPARSSGRDRTPERVYVRDA